MATAQTTVDFGGIRRPQGHLGASALDAFPGPLNERLAAHLLRRAGFDGTPKRFAATRRCRVRMRRSIAGALPVDRRAARPDNAYSPVALLSQYGPMGCARARTSAKISTVRFAPTTSRCVLQLWWLNRMLTTPAPLQEKMALYFHGHFTSTAIQKGVSPAMIYNQNQLFRRQRARKSARAHAQRFEGSGDVGLPRQRRQLQVASQRKLRARADGTVYARRQPIFRRRHPRTRRVPGPAGATAALPSRSSSIRAFTTTASRRSSAAPGTSPATTSSTSSSSSRSAHGFLRPACSARSSTTIPSRAGRRRRARCCASTTSS